MFILGLDSGYTLKYKLKLEPTPWSHVSPAWTHVFLNNIFFLVKMDPAKWQNKTYIWIKKIITKWNFWRKKTNLNQDIIQREFESIHLSATNGTFVTKGEIESNFLTTLSDEPKLNHWVKTILNQIVIQFEPSRWCI